jgi:hypothetical protein
VIETVIIALSMGNRRRFSQGGLPQRHRLIWRQGLHATNKSPPCGGAFLFQVLWTFALAVTKRGSPAPYVAQRIDVAPWYGCLLQREPISIGIFGADFSFGGESIKNRWRAAYRWHFG